ncbi:hypothetical protein Vadar_002013 [Vaccinium darrowii]|uniref:Uncharacterized protein n=1 Tax=Vaccinium darrowii TaxID=229202 RepID=A0ACB7XFC0_9ERIC|nr:hypothetical protein Vadar_002013 [Vaccinium darrowii]
MRLDVAAVTEETAVDVVRDEEGDVDSTVAEKLGQLEHGVDVALCWVWEDEHVGRELCFLIIHGAGLRCCLDPKTQCLFCVF